MRGARIVTQLATILLLASGPSAWGHDRERPRNDAPGLVMHKIMLIGFGRRDGHRLIAGRGSVARSRAISGASLKS